MEDRPFDQPVLIVTGKANSVIRGVRSTAKAADYLLNHWPFGAAGLKHRAARIACLRVLEGREKPDTCRTAFVEAAKEAGIWVDERNYRR